MFDLCATFPLVLNFDVICDTGFAACMGTRTKTKKKNKKKKQQQKKKSDGKACSTNSLSMS